VAVGIKLEGFQGLVPRLSDRLLPPMAATRARNVKLLQGEARGFRAPREEADFFGYINVRRAFRVKDNDGLYADDWLTFDSLNVDVVRSPIVNDSYDRYYWAGDGRPKYNTSYRIQTAAPEYYLGIPTPTNAPTVTPVDTTYSDQTRAYVYTFVSEFGEEGPPSPPTIATGDEGQWDITGMDTVVPDAGFRNITQKKIYRTVPGETSTAFFYVATVDVAVSSYNDTETDNIVAANNLLESTEWIEPPTDLEGFVVMPNGYLIGWVGRRIVFSEPYRPHAWPASYELSTEFPVVGMVVYGSSVIIGTTSRPYFGEGLSPAAFTLRKFDAVEPCLSRRGMVATVAGAYYPSLNGLVLADSSGTRIVTQDILTKEEWATYNPSQIYAAALGLQYIAFNSETFGFIFNPTEPSTKLVELDRFTDVVGIETDAYSGDVLLLDGTRAWTWDPETSERLYWQWRSKIYQTPKPVNFGAVKIMADFADQNVSADVEAYYGVYNDARFVAPVPSLGTLGGHVLCGASPQENPGQVDDWTEPEIRQPLAGSGLYNLPQLSISVSGIRFIAYTLDGEGNRTVRVDKVITEETITRLPSGFKDDLWQFEFQGNTGMYSAQIAETAKGLAEI
jgi:hypothetical protein